VSDSSDGNPDDIFEPDEPETEYGEGQFDSGDPAAPYEEGTLDTSPSVPEAPMPDDPSDIDSSNVDPELQKLFWKLVLVIKFSLISLTLGALFVTLGNNPSLGVQLLAFGGVLVSYGIYQYRKSKARIDSEEFDPVQPDSKTTAVDEQSAASTDPGTEYTTGDDS
jgi:hypothetical protein